MRELKFRQAAFVYLHVALLYEAAAYGMMSAGRLPERFGSPWWWLLAGAVLAGLVFYGLYRWQNVWFARVVWGVHGLRLPALVKGAFFAGGTAAGGTAAGGTAATPPSFYMFAIVVVMINLWMLARAAWDL